MNQDLVTFVSARLDEEAELARRCDGVGFSPGELAGLHPAVALHVALHAPARVFREVEAKRRVLNRHALSPAIGDPELPWENRDDCQYDGELWPCDDLLDLASPYADHPDYPRAAAARRSGYGGSADR